MTPFIQPIINLNNEISNNHVFNRNNSSSDDILNDQNEDNDVDHCTENNKCNICSIEVLQHDSAIRCDKCRCWYHIKCAGISLIQYEHYQINHEEVFHCKSCRTCNVCQKTIAKNHKKLSCSVCEKVTHIKCNLYSVKDYENYQQKTTEDHYCINCIKNAIPFSGLNDTQFHLVSKKGILNTENTKINLGLSPFQQQLCNELNQMINNNAFDLNSSEDDNEEDIDDENCVLPAINCNYYTTDEFLSNNFNSSKNFSVLHLNIHSINRHIEEFRLFLLILEFQFDVICLSESKIEDNTNPIVDISIAGYQKPESTPTEATKGGVLIYVKDGLDYKIRKDLNVYKAKELETNFIEIINKKSANEIVGVIYRHPTMSENEFIDDYMCQIFDKLSQGNKKVYIAGDFNFDLLNIEKHHETSLFFDLMMSNFLLPVINKPTKINRINNTLIDNIFMNNLNPDTKSGNICINFSDGHLPSFLITPKPNQNHIPKKHNFYMRDMKKFPNGHFPE